MHKTAATLIILFLSFVLLAGYVDAAFQQGTPQQLSDFNGAPKGSLYNDKTDGALLGGCGPGAKEFLKKKSSNPSSIDGLKPAFACALQKLIQGNPGVTIGVGTYKTTQSSAKGADCTKVQCREGANANGGTHEKGCAADLLYNGQKGPIGPSGPPWCKSNHLCDAVHQKASGLGLQFRLMPPSYPLKSAEVWHVELKGASAGHCPESADGSGGGSGGSPSSGSEGQSGGGSGSSTTPKITPEDLEHQQIEKDPNILRGSNTLAGQEGAVFGDTTSTGAGQSVAGTSGSNTATGGEGDDKVTSENVVQRLVDSAQSSQEPTTPEPKGFFASAQDTLSKWWYGGLDRLVGGSSSGVVSPSTSWQSLQTSSSAPFQFRFFGF